VAGFEDFDPNVDEHGIPGSFGREHARA